MQTTASLMRLTRNELALVVSQFFFSIGFEAAYFIGITGYAAYTLNANATLIATVMFVLYAGHMVGSLAGGFLIDRFGPRAVILFAGLLSVTYSIGAQFVGTSIPAFMLLSGVVGFCIAIGTSAFESFAPYLEETREGLARINAILKLSGYSAVIVGPAIGAVVVTNFATERVFLFGAVTAVLGVLAIWLTSQVREPQAEASAAEPMHPVREALEGARLLLTVPSLRLYLVLGILMWFAFGAFDALESLYYRYTVNVDVQWMGWANASIGAGLLLGALLVTRIPGPKITATLLASFVCAVGAASVIYVGTGDIRVVMVGAFLVGLTFGMGETLLPTLIQSDAPFWAVGRVMGSMQFLQVGSMLLPLAIAPALSQIMGIQGVLVAASLMTVALAAAVIPATRRLDRERASLRHIEPLDPLSGPE